MTAAAALALLLAASAAAPSRGASLKGAFKGKSVVLVSIDTLRADHLGAYGYRRATSPTVDALAKESVVFEQAYSQAPLTAPSHMTMMTGVLPPVHGVMNQGTGGVVSTRLSDALPTLATLLQRAGYQTVAQVGGGNVSPELGFEQGFDAYAANWPGSLPLAGRALEATARGGRPFFFFAHTYEVHDPYLPRPEALRLFARPDYAGRLLASKDAIAAATGSHEWGDVVKEFWKRFDATSPADLEQLVAMYDGEILGMDGGLREFLASFREAGLERSAILVFTSDHGEEFLEHGATRHGPHVYQEILHVPLIVRLPGGAPGRRTDTVRIVDLMPTLLDLLGLPIPAHVQGAPLFAGGPERPRPVYANEPHNGAQTLRVGAMKYLSHAEREELFDLEKDPLEKRNLLTADAAYVWRERVGRILRSCLELGARFSGGATVAIDPRTRQELEALGYVGAP